MYILGSQTFEKIDLHSEGFFRGLGRSKMEVLRKMDAEQCEHRNGPCISVDSDTYGICIIHNGYFKEQTVFT